MMQRCQEVQDALNVVLETGYRHILIATGTRFIITPPVLPLPPLPPLAFAVCEVDAAGKKR